MAQSDKTGKLGSENPGAGRAERGGFPGVGHNVLGQGEKRATCWSRVRLGDEGGRWRRLESWHRGWLGLGLTTGKPLTRK